MYSYVIVTIVCYIYLQLFRTLLGWELGEQIMNCFLLKPAEPETCLGRRTKPILHSWPRRHAGKGSWLSSRLQNTVPGSGERVCIVTWVFLEMHLSDSKLDNEGGWKKLLYSLFFTFSFNLCLLEHPSLYPAKHQWQKWRQHSSFWVVKFTDRQVNTYWAGCLYGIHIELTRNWSEDILGWGNQYIQKHDHVRKNVRHLGNYKSNSR